MANPSARMKWPEIKEFLNPWKARFDALVQAMDASSYAAREDRHLIFSGGGLFTFDAIANSITWAATLEVASPISGFLLSLPVPTAPLTLLDGQVLYVDLVRHPTENAGIVAAAAAQVPSSDTHLVLGVRRDTKVYFRTGAVLKSAVPKAVFDTDGAFPHYLPLTLTESTDQSTFEVVGTFELGAQEFEGVSFVTTANVTSGGLTGEVQLYNLTDAAVVATHSYPGTLTPTTTSSVVSLPQLVKTYEVRHRVLGGTPPNDQILTSWAGFRLT